MFRSTALPWLVLLFETAIFSFLCGFAAFPPSIARSLPATTYDAIRIAESLLPPRIRGASDMSRHWGRQLKTIQGLSGLWGKLSLLPQPKEMPDDLQLLIGVFMTKSLEREDEVRAVLRRTWMRHRGVCWLQRGQRLGCSVYVAFVLGNGSPGSDESLVLEVPENMDEGKTYFYFREAPRRFPWLSHVAKSDLDTFIWPSGLLWSLYIWRLRVPHAGCYEFGGEATTDYDRALCKAEDDFGNLRNESFLDKDCEYFMQGGFYIMDRALALAVTAPGAPWSLGEKAGYEDRLSSRRVADFVLESRSCISLWSAQGGFKHFMGTKVLKRREGDEEEEGPKEGRRRRRRRRRKGRL